MSLTNQYVDELLNAKAEAEGVLETIKSILKIKNIRTHTPADENDYSAKACEIVFEFEMVTVHLRTVVERTEAILSDLPAAGPEFRAQHLLYIRLSRFTVIGSQVSRAVRSRERLYLSSKRSSKSLLPFLSLKETRFLWSNWESGPIRFWNG